MYNEFKLEIVNNCEALGLLEGDEVVYCPQTAPRANGGDLAVLEVKGELLVAAFTKYGSQYLIIGERIQVYKQQQVRIIGKVVDGTHLEIKMPTAVTVG